METNFAVELKYKEFELKLSKDALSSVKLDLVALIDAINDVMPDVYVDVSGDVNVDGDIPDDVDGLHLEPSSELKEEETPKIKSKLPMNGGSRQKAKPVSGPSTMSKREMKASWRENTLDLDEPLI